MRWIKLLGFFSAIILAIACFYPWVIIVSKDIVVTGFEAEEISLGKPGYLHLVFIFFFLVFIFIPKLWAKRTNLLVTALNMAWAIRNYFIITSCLGGECPEKQVAIYLIIPASLVMLISSLFPDMKVKEQKNNDQ